ncbi:MAG: nuclear transport factor 2 family protein [Polyangiaceae bacterium]
MLAAAAMATVACAPAARCSDASTVRGEYAPGGTMTDGLQKTRTHEEARNLELIAGAFEKWKRGTGGPFDLLAPEAQWTIVGNSSVSKTYPNKKAFMDAVIVPFNARMSSPLVPHMRGLYADADMVIALFDAAATVRDGKPYRNTYSWFMRMAQGRVVEVTAFFDSVEFNDFWARVAPAP